jgi:hypothetical protein
MSERNLIQWKYRNFPDLDKEDLNIFLEPATPSKSTWHKSLPFYSSTNAKNYLGHWKAWWESFKAGRVTAEELSTEFAGDQTKGATITGKKCPGILGILNKSYIVKAPVEMYIHIEDGDIRSMHSADKRFVTLDSHRATQYRTDKSPLFQNKKSLKITLPVDLKTHIPYVFFNPVYHKDTELDVLPGVIEDHHIHNIALVVHCMVDVSKDHYIHIKPGDPIAYMWLPEKTKLKYNPNFKDKRYSKYLNRAYQFIGKN